MTYSWCGAHLQLGNNVPLEWVFAQVTVPNVAQPFTQAGPIAGPIGATLFVALLSGNQPPADLGSLGASPKTSGIRVGIEMALGIPFVDVAGSITAITDIAGGLGPGDTINLGIYAYPETSIWTGKGSPWGRRAPFIGITIANVTQAGPTAPFTTTVQWPGLLQGHPFLSAAWGVAANPSQPGLRVLLPSYGQVLFDWATCGTSTLAKEPPNFAGNPYGNGFTVPVGVGAPNGRVIQMTRGGHSSATIIESVPTLFKMSDATGKPVSIAAASGVSQLLWCQFLGPQPIFSPAHLEPGPS
jgi:hypothetical protein